MENIEYFIELLDKGGVYAVVGFVGLVLAVAIFFAPSVGRTFPTLKKFLSTWFAVKTDNIKNSNKLKDLESKLALYQNRDLRTHPYFEYMNSCIRLKIPHVEVEYENKTILFRCFLLTKFIVFKDNFYRLVEDDSLKKKRFNEMSLLEFQQLITNTFYSSISEYNEQAKQKFLERGVDDELAVYIIDCFDKWHLGTVEFCSDRINNTINSNYFIDNKERFSSILDILTVGFEITIRDGVESFKEINGKLKHLELKKGC